MELIIGKVFSYSSGLSSLEFKIHMQYHIIHYSNTGGHVINKKTQEHWLQGKKREDITYKVMEDVLMTGSFNDKGDVHVSQYVIMLLYFFAVCRQWTLAQCTH
jgi:hypothetical protein